MIYRYNVCIIYIYIYTTNDSISILAEPCNDLQKKGKKWGYRILLVEPSEHDVRECSQENHPSYESIWVNYYNSLT